ncbi:MAG: hypothetical protein M1827_006012 [Pycnora praestabilis]|nr:MAG: hypothetical protein M1827_006012 [Pycnora praestabilis]
MFSRSFIALFACLLSIAPHLVYTTPIAQGPSTAQWAGSSVQRSARGVPPALVKNQLPNTGDVLPAGVQPAPVQPAGGAGSTRGSSSGSPNSCSAQAGNAGFGLNQGIISCYNSGASADLSAIVNEICTACQSFNYSSPQSGVEQNYTGTTSRTLPSQSVATVYKAIFKTGAGPITGLSPSSCFSVMSSIVSVIKPGSCAYDMGSTQGGSWTSNDGTVTYMLDPGTNGGAGL